MSRFTTKNAAGFSLLELMVVVAILGVLATFAVPRFNIFRARARQAEAKSNLGVIFTLQEAFKIDKERYYNGDSGHWGGADMDDDATVVKRLVTWWQAQPVHRWRMFQQCVGLSDGKL